MDKHDSQRINIFLRLVISAKSITSKHRTRITKLAFQMSLFLFLLTYLGETEKQKRTFKTEADYQLRDVSGLEAGCELELGFNLL
jgi:hypothetical protein